MRPAKTAHDAWEKCRRGRSGSLESLTHTSFARATSTQFSEPLAELLNHSRGTASERTGATLHAVEKRRGPPGRHGFREPSRPGDPGGAPFIAVAYTTAGVARSLFGNRLTRSAVPGASAGRGGLPQRAAPEHQFLLVGAGCRLATGRPGRSCGQTAAWHAALIRQGIHQKDTWHTGMHHPYWRSNRCASSWAVRCDRRPSVASVVKSRSTGLSRAGGTAPSFLCARNF